jgi:hypothetical protein
MIPKLVDYLNQTVLVSIPVLHADAKCRSFTLLGVEMQGLWLQDEALVSHLASEATDTPIAAMAPVFVPFSHVAFVLLPAPVTRVVGFPAVAEVPAGEPSARGAVQKHAQSRKAKKK